MRQVVVGIGAVGGLLAARLAQAGHEVLAVARGEHGRVVASDGLTVHSPLRTDVVPLDVVDVASDFMLRPDDVVVLAVKSHQTQAAMDSIRARWPRPLPIVCAQNGVANELFALRHSPTVIACNVLLPATHLEAGHVHAHWAPLSGVLDLGPFDAQASTGALVDELCAVLESATFSSRHHRDILRWKYAKLLMNLGNAVEAVCGPESRGGPMTAILAAEGRQAFAAAGIAVASLEDIGQRTQAAGDKGTAGNGFGGSTWQSIERGAVELETDYLNGEVVLLGRRHGVPTPANELVRELANRWARTNDRPEPLTEGHLVDLAGQAATTDPADLVDGLLDPAAR